MFVGIIKFVIFLCEHTNFPNKRYMETWGKVLLVVENHFKWLQIGYKHWLIPGPIHQEKT